MRLNDTIFGEIIFRTIQVHHCPGDISIYKALNMTFEYRINITGTAVTIVLNFIPI
jgi:hypothetical protein